MRFAFIKEHRTVWPVEVICQVLCVSRGGYYAWKERPQSDQEQRREELISKIQIVHEQSRRTYGSPRITAELKEQGVSVCRNTVARLMKEAEICPQVRRRFVPCTTDSAHEHPIPPNHLDRDFAAEAPNQKWACDITYLPTDHGWLYLAVVLDLYSRKVVGWSMQEHMKAELVEEALAMAVASRRPEAGLLHHSDRGVQYACGDYQILLKKHGISCSMSRKGNCYDNAVVESFFGKLKTELVYCQSWADPDQARSAVFSYIEVFYNRQRRHSSLNYLSPEAFEARSN
jgi:transposase InsO family protein